MTYTYNLIFSNLTTPVTGYGKNAKDSSALPQYYILLYLWDSIHLLYIYYYNITVKSSNYYLNRIPHHKFRRLRFTPTYRNYRNQP